MNFFQAVESGFRKYIDFTGRATRSEYWYWMLFSLSSIILLYKLQGILKIPLLTPTDVGPVVKYWMCALALPTWTVIVRRLHDIDKSVSDMLCGRLLLGDILDGAPFIFLFFCVISIVTLPFCLWREGTSGTNRFGEDPLLKKRLGLE